MNRKPRKEHAPNIAPLTMWAKNLRLIEIDKNPASQKMSAEKLRHLLPGLCNMIILRENGKECPHCSGAVRWAPAGKFGKSLWRYLYENCD